MEASATPPTAAGASLRQNRRRAWMFALPAVLGMVALFLLVAYRQGILNSKDHLFFLSASAAGVTQGMPVKINGFLIGSVVAIELLPPSARVDQRVRVEMSIYRDYMHYIPKATKARIASETLIGQRVIELLPQRYDSRAVANGEVLEFERSHDATEIAQRVETVLMPLLENVNAVAVSLNDPKAPFQQTLAASHAFVNGLPQVTERLDAVLVQSQRSLQILEKQASSTLQKAGRTIDHVEQAAPPLLGKLDRSAENVQQASADVRAITGRASQQVPEILDGAQAITSQTGQIVQGARQTWPISVFAGPSSAPAALPSDSVEGLKLPTLPP